MPGGGKGGGSATSTVNVNNGPISIDSDSTVDVRGLDHIGVAAKIDPIDVRQELRIPDPIVTKSSSDTKADVTSDSRNTLSVDLKPVVLDVCSTTSTKLPHGEISQPFNLHVGFTWFGTEFLGFNFGGEARTVMQDLPKRPSVEWPAQQNAAATTEPTVSRGDPAPARTQGLRIRIK